MQWHLLAWIEKKWLHAFLDVRNLDGEEKFAF
jgi:hypothetical protein